MLPSPQGDEVSVEMRLINVHTLDLESFDSSDKPNERYAVFSHTLGRNEVDFVDYASARSQLNNLLSQSQTDDPTTGVAKIAEACLQCRNLQLDYLWTYTCCIDKRSLAELVESVNSMFNWYNEAEICLAYLADVGEAYQNFPDSVWFARGWTLQELLGSRDIRFFDRAWTEVGTKTSLSSEIEKATRISQKHLKDFKTASVATRMSWQAYRTTTKIEDLAYSMFGIFDLGIDLRYGEREKAFRRLQEEIIKRYPLDESILAWSFNGCGSDGLKGVLAPRPSCFKDCGDLTVASPSQKYEYRNVYMITNRGLEISVSFIASKMAYFLKAEALKSRLKGVNLTLNCWKEAKPSPATVMIRLVKDDKGFFHRTNCDELDWAETVVPPKTLNEKYITTAIPVHL